MKNFFTIVCILSVLSSCSLMRKAVCPALPITDSTFKTEQHETLTVDTTRIPQAEPKHDTTVIIVDSIKFDTLYLPTVGSVAGRVIKEKGKVVFQCYVNVDSLKAENAKLQSYIVTVNKQLSTENTKTKTIVVTKTVNKIPWWIYLLIVFLCILIVLVIWLALKSLNAGLFKIPGISKK